MIFEMAESIKEDLKPRKVDLSLRIKGMEYEKAKETLYRYLSHYEVSLIESASIRKGRAVIDLWRNPVNRWHSSDASKTLIRLGLVKDYEWGDNNPLVLTKTGVELYFRLKACKIVDPNNTLATTIQQEKKVEFTFTEPTKKQRLINLLAIVREYFSTKIPSFDMSIFDGFKEVFETADKIARINHRVKPEDIQVIPLRNTWTLEDQQEENDLYWEGPSAFWLNPGRYSKQGYNLFAAPTPAPMGWSAPIRATIDHTAMVTLVEQSLSVKESSVDVIDSMIATLEAMDMERNIAGPQY